MQAAASARRKTRTAVSGVGVPEAARVSTLGPRPVPQVLSPHAAPAAPYQPQGPYPQGGFRIVVNTGDEGGQEIHHLHIHVMGGPRPWLKG